MIRKESWLRKPEGLLGRCESPVEIMTTGFKVGWACEVAGFFFFFFFSSVIGEGKASDN